MFFILILFYFLKLNCFTVLPIIKLKSNKKYKDSTKLENTLPIMFIVLYVIAIAAIVVIKYCTQGGTP